MQMCFPSEKTVNSLSSSSITSGDDGVKVSALRRGYGSFLVLLEGYLSEAQVFESHEGVTTKVKLSSAVWCREELLFTALLPCIILGGYSCFFFFPVLAI